MWIHAYFFFLFFLKINFIYGIILDLLKIGKASTESFHVPHTQFPYH